MSCDAHHIELSLLARYARWYSTRSSRTPEKIVRVRSNRGNSVYKMRTTNDRRTKNVVKHTTGVLKNGHRSRSMEILKRNLKEKLVESEPLNAAS